MKKKVYISGPITNDPDYKAKFAKAEKLLSSEYKVINPANQIVQLDWTGYMKIDIAEMLRCDCLYMLKGWQKSKGARLEYDIATRLGMRIMLQM